MARSHLSKLRRQQREATEALETALQKQQVFTDLALETFELLEEEAQTRAEGASDLGLHEVFLRDWLCQDVTADSQAWCPYEIGTLGSGPWPVEEFDAFLSGMGFELAHLPNPKLTCIVLGTEGWDEAALEEQIYGRSGDDLIVMSQAMFVAGLVKQANPLDALDEAALRDIADRHPALAFLIARQFDWRFSVSGGGVVEWEPTGDLAAQSPLRTAGYSVAADGPGEAHRRAVLEGFFFETSPAGLEEPADKRRWGTARSAQRLYSMATFLAWLCRFRGATAPNAVARWQADLQWLKHRFYRPVMKFKWPASATSAAPAPSRATTLRPAAAWPFPTGSKPRT